MGQVSRPLGQLQLCIERMQAGDPAAREELLGQACESLRRLTRKMLKGYGGLKRYELTDDVLQNAMLRLWSALREVRPKSARDFIALAALQIRRELIDLARHYYGPHGLAANQASHVPNKNPAGTPPVDKTESTLEPSSLAVWTEFHEQVDALPEEEREVFDLLWYQQLTQAEAAGLLGISEATLKRRWLAARRRLCQALEGELPGR